MLPPAYAGLTKPKIPQTAILTRMPTRKKPIILPLGSFLILLLLSTVSTAAAERWSTKLDGKVRFYQSTELGVLIVGTEKSLYAVDGETGDVLWRRKNVKLDETDVAPVPGTDIVLLNLESGSKTRVEALDVMTGSPLWRSDKVRGAVMQMALDQNANLLAVVLVRDARGKRNRDSSASPSFTSLTSPMAKSFGNANSKAKSR